MNFKELQSDIEKMTKTKVSLTEIGNALGIKLSTVSTRSKNNSELKYNEIKKIEKYFGISLNKENKSEKEFLTFRHEKIQQMISNLGIGITAYGIYRAITEMISEQKIPIGSEVKIANELSVKEELVKAVLNDFNLFYIRNNFYYSIFPEHNMCDKILYSKIFEGLKTEIYTDLVNIIQKNPR